MKNTAKLFGTIAIVLALAFAMTGCDDNPGNTTADPTLASITAEYTQGSTTVYPTTSLDSLKTNLTVTAHYSDSTTKTVTDYALSGTLSVGASTITVTYEGKTTTFSVTVTADPNHSHDFTGAWKSNSTQHWHECEADGEKADTADHTFNNGICTVCGYDNDTGTNHTHNFSEAWKSNSTQHWHECECEEKSSTANHTPPDGICTVCQYDNSTTTTEYWAINWHLNGGTEGETYPTQIEKGTTLAEPEDPTKDNADFKGWYTNSALTDKYTFDAVNTDLNLYAKWEWTVPMFWWGNYLPEATTANNAWAKGFNLQELIDNIENSRGHLGSGPTANRVWGQEVKGWEVAEKSNKTIDWQKEQIGWRYFIYPKEYGQLKGVTHVVSGDAMMGEYFYSTTENINGIDYYVVYAKNPITTVSMNIAPHRFEFN